MIAAGTLKSNIIKPFNCDTCKWSKNHRISHNKESRRSIQPLENVHLDLSGIIRTDSIFSYYALFTDDFTSYRTGFPLVSKSKYNVLEVIKIFIAKSERQKGHKLINLTIEGGMEFNNSEADRKSVV